MIQPLYTYATHNLTWPSFASASQMDKLLTEYEEKTGIHVPIHVDAASGGFVAPFAHPNFKMSFDIPRVVSINTSGHKFGLAFVGVGWVVWKSKEFLPKELVFEVRRRAKACLSLLVASLIEYRCSFTISAQPSSPSRSTCMSRQFRVAADSPS